jgi:molybdopterin synthase catalytic subunit
VKEKKKHKVLTEGPILPSFISGSIEKHASKKDIGAHDIFLGQVRADEVSGKSVTAIDYSAYDEMAEEVFHEIREEAFLKFELSCLHIYHSTGLVKSGEISLFVFTSSRHRKEAFEACRFIVEEIKKRAPVWGREIFEGGDFQWKKNNG